ncbi:hypothetical protein AB6A40_001202 [Gnathostoma spinigerum]|uniref:FPL domain-containing protein n=1 Tax=Gnathostoma spinigerum TaxID=75299 RepID=A0ABD6E3T0_9BILA
MFKRFGASSGIWKPKNPYTLEYLKYLHGVLVKNETVTDGNRKLLVEALRAIAEILIWGDQNDSSVFDFFLERQMLSHFLTIMRQQCGSYVCVQLLQTLNILFENIRHETSLYFLLSNNHVNWIITHKFDFENEEIMAYYISFLKILSFKLNPYTIHFFFNEAAQEFPLYTEVIKFYNHSEGMVRIAVRTTTLNIFKVQDESMRAFVRSRSREYFCSLVDMTVYESVSMDQFARSAENEASNRDRLSDFITEELDHIHYFNDIFLIKDRKLTKLLLDILYQRLIGPLYLCSLIPSRRCDSTIILTSVSSLFLLSQFLLTVDDSQVVNTVLSSFFFDNESDIHHQWIRSRNGDLNLVNIEVSSEVVPRIFFKKFLCCLDCELNDHAAFYALLLVYAICQNKGVTEDLLDAAQISRNLVTEDAFDQNLFNSLLSVLQLSSQRDTTVRVVTVELCCMVLRWLLLAAKDESVLHPRALQQAEDAQSALISFLSSVIYTEELFLEMFEDEYYQFERENFHLAAISCDSSLLLPPTNTPLSGVAITKRLTSGSEERIRRVIQLYFHFRKFIFDLRGEEEVMLPLSAHGAPVADINDCINLDNSDLLSCTVVFNKAERQQRFLVADQIQLILVEPDTKRLGWAIVRFVGLLQDTQMTGDPGDSRALHVVVNDVRSRSGRTSEPLLSAKFIFDDHIRCMAAKQRLTKGRQKARQFKLDLICDLLGIARKQFNPGCNRNPFRIVKGCAPGCVRRQQHSRTSPDLRSSNSSLNAVVPDDPKPGTTSAGSSVINLDNVKDV